MLVRLLLNSRSCPASLCAHGASSVLEGLEERKCGHLAGGHASQHRGRQHDAHCAPTGVRKRPNRYAPAAAAAGRVWAGLWVAADGVVVRCLLLQMVEGVRLLLLLGPAGGKLLLLLLLCRHPHQARQSAAAAATTVVGAAAVAAAARPILRSLGKGGA